MGRTESMHVRIRPAVEGDAADVVRLYSELTAHLRGLGEKVQDRLTTAAFVRDGFGPSAAFSTLVAEAAPSSALVGYLIYTIGYDAEYAERIVHIVDLYVTASSRKHGVGTRLMSAAGESARSLGATRAYWTVARSNSGAQVFYNRLGAEAIDATCMEWDL